ncbi:acid sphingomyelinase family phosphodiesterase, putative [Entamoeba histolytica HM-1:IMSS-B]|uniref:Calcineurin-like phosphoesterase domain-containing protein n=7 Tax=Entamoeba histolytica TaxID=5759 RepID=C4M8T6_ENTH1|nr:hypothetical protein, conserved [Entamoeba histolytica HM-1:IMSS]EMD43487.1 sphingomyelin phosphodiesterase, putative [Entamoeba histolytica KU27]EMH77311.1 acid sphingomyelinase family phosphodiesterase, putative [Entamoeba histolytica HM-1:IMSS-B]EMS17543.1 sphingomyelin phosphodiesterase, putative [Entamoeba histolytica HM-3:IMSS]ENY61015.1 sphingomyelin phosphodiesterase, putative [Entamoeba histolytica HM-1:IMSS-A]GAT98034.1 hypothetical protein conserved [Entamoeba histolytica]|eukprot:XP_650430.1 hypothetical protein, conserved [Entamoeba histolytica HM-1:IMSS]
MRFIQFTFLLISVCFAFKAWVITDSHFDRDYTVGAYSRCNEMDCCHDYSVPKKGKEEFISGPCGDYNCYPPLNVSQSAIDFIYQHRDESKIVFWMMDTLPATFLKQSKERNVYHIKTQAMELQKRLPGFKVFPAPGNHDYFKHSEWQFPPESQWMLEIMIDLFKPWLSDSSLETFRKGGYYTELIDSGMRLISLNMAYLDVYGIHSQEYPAKDPGNMVAWLNSTLKEAKENKERVVLIFHEPIGLKSSGAVTVHPRFNQDFNHMMTLYGDIIITILTGHEHLAAVRLLPSYENPTFSVIGNPACTSRTNLDPRIRLVEFDIQSLIGWKEYKLDIEKCNSNGKLDWEFDYDTKSLFGFDRLSLQDTKEFIRKLEKDDSFFDKYRMHCGFHNGKEYPGNSRHAFICSLISLTETQYLDCVRNGPIQ